MLAGVRPGRRPSSGYGRGRRRGPARVELDIADDAARLGWSSSTRRGGPSSCPVGTLALFYGKVGTYREALQLVNPMAEVLGACPARTTGTGDGGDGGTGRHPAPGRMYPVYPLTEKAKLTSIQHQPVRGRGPRPGGRLRRPAATPPGAGPVRAGRPDDGLQPHPPPRPLGGRRSRPGGGWPSTSSSACSWPWCCASGGSRRDARGIRHAVTGRTEADGRWTGPPTLVGRFLGRAPVRAHGRPAAGHRRHPCRSGRSAAHAPAPPGRRRVRARRWWPWPPCSWRSRVATRAPSWHRPRSWPNSTPPRSGPC